LFLPHVGTKGPIKHSFREFQNSLGDRRKDFLEFPLELRESKDGRVQAIVRDARERGEYLPGDYEELREILYELLSEESCAEWLGSYYVTRAENAPPPKILASLIRDPDLTDAENVHKLRLYRAAAFIDCLRSDVIDWETPHIPDMELVLKFAEVFTRPGISVEDQTDLIDDLSRPRVPLEMIVQSERGPRLQLSLNDLRYVWETRNLSHEERAIAWDNRTPKPFQPFGCSNVEMYRDKEACHKWRVAVKYQTNKAKKLFDSDGEQDEGEAN